MKKFILSAMSLAVILTGCMTTNNSSSDKNDEALTLRLPTDGADQVHIRHDKLWYVHLENCYPGQWSGRNDPTYINDEAWYPQWPYYHMTSDKYTIPDPAFVLPANVEFTKDTMKVKFSDRESYVMQYPNSTNEYTLVLYMYERAYIGPVWKTVKISWSNDVETAVAPQAEAEAAAAE